MDRYFSSFCTVSSSNGTYSIAGNANGFNQIVFSTITSDNGNNFNLLGGYYNVPTTGIYIVVTKLRLPDNAAALSYGQGAGATLQDATYFAWYQTNSGSGYNRNSSVNVRMASLSAGSKIFMYGYGFSSYVSAEMNIALVSAAAGSLALPANGLSGSDASGNPIAVTLGQGLTLSNGVISATDCLLT